MKAQAKWKHLAGVAAVSLFLGQAHGQWIINELQADPDATLGDANGDGSVSTSQDEFVEIVNSTGGSVDIGGWTISDGAGLRHTFPMPTLVGDGQAVVVFGGGTPTGTFGGAVVQTATAGFLGLNNGGDSVTLADDLAVTQATYTYGGEGGNNESITRDPDLTGASLVSHSTATGSGGALFSPGTLIDGSPFVAGSGTLSVSPTMVTLDETGGVSSANITVTLSVAPASYPFTVTLSSSDTGEASVPASVDIVSGTSAMFTITAVDDALPDGAQVATVTAAGFGFGSDDVTVTVNDDGDTGVPSASDLLITQYYEGSSNNKYIELTNVGASSINLANYVLARWSNGDEAWKSAGGTPANSTALTGTLAAGASYVLANPSAVSPILASNADISGEAAFFNGDDTVTLHTSASFDPVNLVDAIMFTSAFEGGNTSFVRLNNFVGYDLDPGTSVLDYNFVWQEITTATVDAASFGDDAFLGSSVLGSNDPVVFFQSASAVVNEGDGTYNVVVEILNPDGNSVMVDVALDGASTAVAADIDNYTTQTVTFGAGAVSGDTQTVIVTLTDDLDVESSEDAIFVLQNVVTAGAAAVGGNTTSTVTIQDNDTVIPDIYISEIADPGDNSGARFVELYNPTASPVDLAAGNWNLVVYFNANISGSEIPLTGIIPAMGTYVIANNATNHAAAYPSAPAADQVSGTVNSNGDDNFELRFGGGQATGTLVDIYGSPGTDGTGMPWEFTDSQAMRNASVTAPNSTFTIAEWTITSGGTSIMTPGSLVPTTPAGIVITAFSIVPSTGVGSATFTTTAAAFYDIYESNDLDQADPWALVDVGTYTQTDNLDGTFTLDFTDVGASGAPTRFYQVREAP